MKKFLLLVFAFLIFPFFVSALDMVEINTASLTQLDTLTGIGQTYAQRIVDGRPYSSVDDLLRVKGIGPKTLQKIKEQGLAYVKNQAIQPIPQTPIKTPSETPHKALAEPLDVLPAETPLQDVVVPIAYPAGIVINEILPSPEGPDETEEWIEIYNQNSFEVNLSNWQIKDSEGSTTVYVFPNTTLIKQKGYLVFTRPTTKIVLNNTGDRLTLLNPGKEISDAITYAKSPNSQSYNRINNEWQWSNALTPGLTNIIKNVTMEKTKESANNLSRNILEDKLITAALNREPKQSKSFLFAFLTALIIAFILTTIFLFLKTRLNNK